MCVCVGVCVLLASVFSYKKQNKNNNLSPIFAVLLEYMSALFKSLVRLLSCGLSLTFGGRANSSSVQVKFCARVLVLKMILTADIFALVLCAL